MRSLTALYGPKIDASAEGNVLSHYYSKSLECNKEGGPEYKQSLGPTLATQGSNLVSLLEGYVSHAGPTIADLSEYGLHLRSRRSECPNR